MSDANLMALYSEREPSYGVAPSGNWQTERFTSESLAHEQGTTTSQEIRSDRQIADLVRNSIRAAGEVAIEFSYNTYNEWLEEALFSTFSAAIADTDTVYSMDDTDNSINDSGSGFVALGFQVGMWIRVSGFTTSANNGLFRITSVATNKMVLAFGTVVTEAAGDTVTIENDGWASNGTTLLSRAFEKHYTDNTNDYSLLLGMAVNTFGLSLTPDGIITGAFSYIGKSETSDTSSAAGTPVAATTTEVMNAIDNVTAIYEDGTASTIVTEFAFDLNNNIRERLAIGQLGAVSLGSGTIDITGTFRAYYESAALYNKLLNFTVTSFALVLTDNAGNIIIFEFPHVKFSSGNRVASGINTDVLADLSFQAFRDSTENKSIYVTKIDA